MQRVHLNDSQFDLQKLIKAALKGEAVFIVEDDNQVIQLVPVRQPRKPGSAQGQIWMSEDFDDPLPGFEEYTE